MSDQEIEEKLNELESAFPEADATPEVLAADEASTIEKEKPPGFKTYDEWVGEGKDPADFRGENAYKKQYEALKEVRELKDTMGHVVDGMSEWKVQQQAQMDQQLEQSKVEARAELESARSDEDIDAALAAQNKINQLENQPVKQQSLRPNPILNDFANQNPIINSDSSQYDEDFSKTMAMMHNGMLDQILGGDRSRSNELTPDQISRSQKLAFSKTKELYPEKFVSPKINRSTVAVPTQRSVASNGDVRSKLKQIKVDARNKRDTSAATDMYDYLLSVDAAVAAKFAENIMGE